MLKLFEWLRGRPPEARKAADLYGSIVAQARDPKFYRDFGVKDVAEKRYELIVLHIVIVLERLRAAGAPGMAVGQALVEAFVSDLDGSIREMALGDTKVPANVKKAAGGLFDRDVLYRQAFSNSASTSDSEPMTLAELLSELVFEGGNEDGAARLLSYTTNARAALAEWEPLGADTLPPFPKPAAIVKEKT